MDANAIKRIALPPSAGMVLREDGAVLRQDASASLQGHSLRVAGPAPVRAKAETPKPKYVRREKFFLGHMPVRPIAGRSPPAYVIGHPLFSLNVGRSGIFVPKGAC
jgi:hypothetical protein